ncbi:hypothetical protein SAMN06265377_0686 [Flagellimonas pacifica]|uniref:Uncharacterized protein n=1 Tax=Flagellimonas pacifica TaxID=1247520 RepID=A0A285MCY6_9FLAO|nr:hypothetical protein SAMN06265377_0686 [Allomuricauda parva]
MNYRTGKGNVESSIGAFHNLARIRFRFDETQSETVLIEGQIKGR